MKVIVVNRRFCCWEDSYTQILGVCMTDEKANELIEIDKHKDDHPKMDKASWLAYEDYCIERRKNLIHYEGCGAKKGGFLKRFHYDGLNKVAKHAYDELLKKYNNKQFTVDLWYEFDELDAFYLYQILNKDLTKLTYEEYQEIDNWYSDNKRREDPEHIFYDKEIFEVL